MLKGRILDELGAEGREGVGGGGGGGMGGLVLKMETHMDVFTNVSVGMTYFCRGWGEGGGGKLLL